MKRNGEVAYIREENGMSLRLGIETSGEDDAW